MSRPGIPITKPATVKNETQSHSDWLTRGTSIVCRVLFPEIDYHCFHFDMLYSYMTVRNRPRQGHKARRTSFKMPQKQLLASPLSPIASKELHENPCESSAAAGATTTREPSICNTQNNNGQLMTDMACDKDGLVFF